ncbi:MAG: hypothetical protein Kow00127_13020 [Bacteroidales bacterium]
MNELYRKALLLEQQGDWDQAHRIVQEINTRDAARIHAFLHRVEGDLGNASYWYRRASESPFQGSLQEEREYLAKRFNIK